MDRIKGKIMMKAKWSVLLWMGVASWAYAEPVIYYGLMNQTDGVQVLAPVQSSFSRTGSRPFCWVAAPVVATDKAVAVEEVFASPKGAVFKGAEGLSKSDADGSRHILQYQSVPNSSKQVAHCIQFDQTDPAGAYQVKVSIDGQALPGFSFELLP